MNYSEKWVIEQANLRKGIWENLLSKYFDNFNLEIIGSLRTGLYHGPKIRFHSLNSECPSIYRNIIEVDLRLILDNKLHPHDNNIISVVKEITGLSFTKRTYVKRWHRNIPITFLYKYDKLYGGLALEWELCINQKPYLETSLFWKSVFTKEEIKFQRQIRELARKYGCDYATEFTPLKEAQAAEARWRIVASYALSEWMASQSFKVESALSTPPLSGNIPTIVEPLTKMWLLGQTGISPPDRPDPKVAYSFFAKICESNSLIIPPEPNWVVTASEIQKQICN